MNLLVDTDAFCKLGVAGLIEDAAGVFGARLPDCGRLPALPHMLRRGALVKRYGRNACDALILHAEAMPVLPKPGAAALDPLAANDAVDPGEAQLFAASAEFDLLVVSGDKRAMRALKHVREIHAPLARRLVTLEAILLKLCERIGLEDLRRRVGPLAVHDKAIGVCFSRGSPESKLPAIDPGMQHPPPGRKETARGRQEPIAHHQRGPIQNLPVDVDLIVQPAQAVSIRLDFVAVQEPVHHGDVDPHAAAAQPQLLDDGRCGILTVFFAEPDPDPQSRTNGRIPQTLRSLPQTAEV